MIASDGTRSSAPRLCEMKKEAKKRVLKHLLDISLCFPNSPPETSPERLNVVSSQVWVSISDRREEVIHTLLWPSFHKGMLHELWAPAQNHRGKMRPQAAQHRRAQTERPETRVLHTALPSALSRATQQSPLCVAHSRRSHGAGGWAGAEWRSQRSHTAGFLGVVTSQRRNR